MTDRNFYYPHRDDEFPVNRYISYMLGKEVPISRITVSGENKLSDDTMEILIGEGFQIIWSKTYYKTDLTPGHEYALQKATDRGTIIIANVSMYGTDPWYELEDEESDYITKVFGKGDKKEKEESKYENISFCMSNHSEFDYLDGLIKRIATPGVKKKSGHLYLIVSGRGGSLDTEPFKIDCPEVDIELNYGKEFSNSYDVIHKSLNDFGNDERGRLLLLHGLPGTGKTTFINYLINKIDRKVLWLPTILAESMTSPGFLNLLIENKGCVVVIEDAERVIGDRSTSSSSSVGVSNILNLTDGALGDALKVHVIATFNTKKENIDSALLRSGRLIACHEFGKLSIDDSNRLLEHLGKDHVTDKEMILSDIYGVGNEPIINNAKEPGKKIGFGS